MRVQKDIAAEQAKIMAEALKSANIDIVGGETEFFDKITSAITTGKAIDRTVNNSKALTDVKETFFNGDPEYFKGQIKNWIDDFGITSEDMKNLSISAVIGKMLGASPDAKTANDLTSLLNATTRFGMAGEKADKVLKSIG
ncbi:MAG: flotillin [Verrucomicrobiales bacterium]